MRAVRGGLHWRPGRLQGQRSCLPAGSRWQLQPRLGVRSACSSWTTWHPPPSLSHTKTSSNNCGSTLLTRLLSTVGRASSLCSYSCMKGLGRVWCSLQHFALYLSPVALSPGDIMLVGCQTTVSTTWSRLSSILVRGDADRRAYARQNLGALIQS